MLFAHLLVRKLTNSVQNC